MIDVYIYLYRGQRNPTRTGSRLWMVNQANFVHCVEQPKRYMIIVNTREMYSISKQFVASKSLLIDEQRWSTPLEMGLLYSIQQTAFHVTSILSYIPITLSSLVQQLLRTQCFPFTLKIIFANIHSVSSKSTSMFTASNAVLKVEIGIRVLLSMIR